MDCNYKSIEMQILSRDHQKRRIAGSPGNTSFSGICFGIHGIQLFSLKITYESPKIFRKSSPALRLPHRADKEPEIHH
jgi:hypothetical protein